MTCKDCIHSDVCGKKIYTPDNGCKCDDFKDKSRFIEKPCDVGDTLYCDGKYFASHCAGKIHSFRVDAIITDVESYFRGQTDYCFDFDDFGKIVFLTSEEAEKALKERKNEE